MSWWGPMQSKLRLKDASDGARKNQGGGTQHSIRRRRGTIQQLGFRNLAQFSHRQDRGNMISGRGHEG